MPVSQYNNNYQLYEFDLIHSEVLPVVKYSGKKLPTCFNIYKRPLDGINKNPPDFSIPDVEIKQYRRTGNENYPSEYDYAFCAWGNVGKEIEYPGQYALEFYIIIKDKKIKDKVINLLKKANWREMYPNISAPVLTNWKVMKHLKDNLIM